MLHISFVLLDNFSFHVGKQSLRLLLRKRLLSHETVVDYIIVKVELQLVKQQRLHVSRRALSRVLDLVLVVVEHLVDLSGELGRGNLRLEMALEDEHVGVASHKQVHQLLERVRHYLVVERRGRLLLAERLLRFRLTNVEALGLLLGEAARVALGASLARRLLIGA